MESGADMDDLTLAESESLEDSKKRIVRMVLIMAIILAMILPFVTTFNEFLTRIVETAGLDRILTEWIAPVEARLIAVLLDLVGIPIQVSNATIYLNKGGFFLPVFISWNCVGWQSFLLFAITLATGFQGAFSRRSKIEAIVLGFLGLFMMNLLRIASVAVVAFYFGSSPALMYHDYGGPIIILLWLFGFWWFSHGWLLEPVEEFQDEADDQNPSFLRDIYAGRANAAGEPRR
jgi:exosortase/archaeosortase family protein